MFREIKFAARNHRVPADETLEDFPPHPSDEACRGLVICLMWGTNTCATGASQEKQMLCKAIRNGRDCGKLGRRDPSNGATCSRSHEGMKTQRAWRL